MEGGFIPIPLKAAEERGMEVMEGWKGAGFEVRAVLREEVDGELRGELFYILNVFLFFHPPLSPSLSLWFSTLVTRAALEVQVFHSPRYS